MVGFLPNSAIEGVKAQVAEDVIRNQPLSDSKKANDLFLPELDEFPLSFSESFLDFESLNGWFMEGGGANIADLGENPVHFEMLKGELIDIKRDIDVFGELISGKDENVEDLNIKTESLLGSELKDGEIGEGDVGGDGGEVKIEDFGCLIEEQLGKVSLDGAVVASVKCENGWGEFNVIDSSQSVKMAVAGCDDIVGGNMVEVTGNANKVDESVDDGDESGSDEEPRYVNSNTSLNAIMGACQNIQMRMIDLEDHFAQWSGFQPCRPNEGSSSSSQQPPQFPHPF